MNELIPNKTWLQRNKMRLYLMAFVVFSGLVVFVISGGTENAANYIEVYSNPDVYQNAVIKANENLRVKEVLGKLEPIDKLAVAEGNVLLSNNNQTFEMTSRVQGEKGKAKIKIFAEKTDGIWNYKTITITIKDTEEPISIIDK